MAEALGCCGSSVWMCALLSTVVACANEAKASRKLAIETEFITTLRMFFLQRVSTSAAQRHRPVRADRSDNPARSRSPIATGLRDGKSGVWGKSVSVRDDLGGRRNIKKKTK